MLVGGWGIPTPLKNDGVKVSGMKLIYHLVMANSSPWNITMLLIGKPR